MYLLYIPSLLKKKKIIYEYPKKNWSKLSLVRRWSHIAWLVSKNESQYYSLIHLSMFIIRYLKKKHLENYKLMSNCRLSTVDK